MDEKSKTDTQDIPQLIRRYRKLIRCLHPWTVSSLYPKHAPFIAVVVEDGVINRGMLTDKEGYQNTAILQKLVDWKREQWR